MFISPFIDGVIIKELIKISPVNYDFKTGVFFDLYGLFFILVMLYLLTSVTVGYVKSSGIRKIQLLYVLIGLYLFSAVSILFGLILPLFGFSKVVPFDSQSSLLWVAFASYAIIKHRFLDIRLIVARTIIYFILIALLTTPFILLVIYYNKFFSEQWGIGAFLTSLILALLIVFGLEPLKKLISRVTDKFLFKGKIDYQEVNKKISHVINKELKLRSLVHTLSLELKRQLKLDRAIILLPKNGDYCLEAVGGDKAVKICKNDSIVKSFRRNREIIIKEEIDRKISDLTNEEKRRQLEAIKEVLVEFDFSLAVPIFSDYKLIAVLLGGNKLSGEIYSHEEIKFFELLSPQIATAISKAYLYKDLENKVKETSELYKLSHQLSKTIDLEESLDQVMSAIVRLAGCDRGLLYLIDETNKYLYTAAGKGDKKEIYQGIKIKIEDSILQKVIITKKPITVKNVAKNPDVAQYAKERLKTPAFIAVPMTIKDKVIGVIGVDNQKTSRPLSEINISLLETLAGHAAIAVENTRLYDELNEFNRTLQQKVDKATKEIKKLYSMKGEFLDIASHQLRTPVSVIIGTLDMLQEGSIKKLPPKQQKRFIENAYRKSRKLESIINDILNASEMDTGKFDVAGTTGPTQIEELVDKVMSDYEIEATDKELEFIFIKPAKLLPQVSVSARYLEQAIGNLLNNAIKYTHKGSIKVQVARKEDNILITVKDTGIGIPKDDMPKLFQKFIRAKNARNIYTDGSGLGLFIIKKIVEGHKGGKIWVESTEGKGTTFFISLPIDKANI